MDIILSCFMFAKPSSCIPSSTLLWFSTSVLLGRSASSTDDGDTDDENVYIIMPILGGGAPAANGIKLKMVCYLQSSQSFLPNFQEISASLLDSVAASKELAAAAMQRRYDEGVIFAAPKRIRFVIAAAINFVDFEELGFDNIHFLVNTKKTAAKGVAFLASQAFASSHPSGA